MDNIFDFIFEVNSSSIDICRDCKKSVNKLTAIKNRKTNEVIKICNECINNYKIFGINYVDPVTKIIDENGVEIFETRGIKYVLVPCLTCKNMPDIKVPYEVYIAHKKEYLEILKARREDKNKE